MGRRLPIWFYLLSLLTGAILALLFAWAAMTTESGFNRAGALGRLAVDVAWFPSVAQETLQELREQLTGDFDGKDNSVPRDRGLEAEGFAALPSRPGIALPGVLMRAGPGRSAYGWRLLAGFFHLNGELENAALLITPEMEVAQAWRLTERPIGEAEPRNKHKKFVHGIEILPDASLIFTFDGSMSLQRIDRCGQLVWARAGGFHHAVTLDAREERLWTFSDFQTLAQVSAIDGTIQRKINVQDIIDANPATDILEIHRKHDNDLGGNSRHTEGSWQDDALHFNDVDPLPAALAHRFLGFAPGDLLVSARALNLVFVLDPDSLQIKWWRMGATQRQHDPDWLPDGRFLILNNRMSRGYSEVVAMDPNSFETEVVFDGRQNDFYTRIRGKVQSLRSGSLLVTSPQQARAFEVDPQGRVALEILNRDPADETRNFVISEMRWLPPTYFERNPVECPSD